jgi:hypothetical protein
LLNRVARTLVRIAGQGEYATVKATSGKAPDPDGICLNWLNAHHVWDSHDSASHASAQRAATAGQTQMGSKELIAKRKLRSALVCQYLTGRERRVGNDNGMKHRDPRCDEKNSRMQ